MIKVILYAVCLIILAIFASRIMASLHSNDEEKYGYYTEEDELEMRRKEDNEDKVNDNNTEKDK